MSEHPERFDALFQPRGIAVIGASADLTRIGGQPIKALLAAGYAGRLYPVNPKYEAIAGIPCVADIANIDGPCDLAIVAVRADMAADAILKCGDKGIKFAIVLSGGFRESGDNGKALEDALVAAGRKAGVRIIGPNCQGMLAVHDRVFAVFGSIAGETGLRAGNVSLCFQSGGVGFAIATLCDSLGIGIRHCVSTGNEADVKAPELIEALLEDPKTLMVGTYIEGVADGRALMAAGDKAMRLGKPLLLWKGGKSETGARAAASHTAQLTGSYDIFQSACRQAGIIEVEDSEEMADLLRAFSAERLPDGRGVGVIGISGGMGIVFADAAIAHGLELPAFSAATVETLTRVIPSFGSSANPADVTASVFNDTAILTETIQAILDDSGIHQLCLLLASVPDPIATQIAEVVIAAATRSPKPILIGWSLKHQRAEKAYALFEAAGIPIFHTPGRTARAAAGLARYAGMKASYRPSPMAIQSRPPVQQLKAGTALDENAGKRLLASYGVHAPREVLVQSDQDLANHIAGLDYPMVVKIVSEDIPHKTEAGGVILNLPDLAAVERAAARVVANARNYKPLAKIEGVLVSEMIGDATEMIVGAVNDQAFGPVIVVGFGGIFAEILKDAAYRVAPCDAATARQMLEELQGYPVLNGARGRPKADVDALVSAIVAASNLVWDLRDQIKEMDINPLLVRPKGKGVLAADALIVAVG
ncbi:MAG: acetate--CoA ligase family protein [Rhizobiales bacterium]|nr:acetate--CoA ligase family protein [Hyphomicrobiales bacterium]